MNDFFNLKAILALHKSLYLYLPYDAVNGKSSSNWYGKVSFNFSHIKDLIKYFSNDSSTTLLFKMAISLPTVGYD